MCPCAPEGNQCCLFFTFVLHLQVASAQLLYIFNFYWFGLSANSGLQQFRSIWKSGKNQFPDPKTLIRHQRSAASTGGVRNPQHFFTVDICYLIERSEVGACSQLLHAKNMVLCISGIFLFLKPAFCNANLEIPRAALLKKHTALC